MNHLETPKFNIHYIKTKLVNIETLVESYSQTEEDIEYGYNPFSLDKMQNYNPIYSEFFSLSENNFDSISLNHQYHFVDLNTVSDSDSKTSIKKPVFIKYSPLVDPFRYMTGKYKIDLDSINNLPKPKELYRDGEPLPLPKLTDYNNASYTDNFFSYLTCKLMHQHNLVHGLEYYGSFLAVQKQFKVNIGDDLEYLESSDYFLQNNNKLFKVRKPHDEDEFSNFGSRTNKSKITITDNSTVDLNIIEINGIDELGAIPPDNTELVYENKKNTSSSESSSSSSSNSETNYSEDEDDSYSSSSSDSDGDGDSITNDEDSDVLSKHSYLDEDGECKYFAYVKDFPVQLICLEKCDGTLDSLFLKQMINEDEAASALFQIIMTLLAYQKAFQFTHNDLHTNNIMYVNTDIKYLYYKYNQQIYKVPTYNKIYKIIDFGRSIYKFQGHLLCSDSFAPGGDGATQYNCEPYMNDEKARIDPNYSFDLSRLGCSMYDFIINHGDDDRCFDDLQKTVLRWVTDDSGKNILYRSNGDERYPNFKLYKMIARTVHNHTPQKQLEYSFFKQFLQKKSKDLKDIIDIDSIPSY